MRFEGLRLKRITRKRHGSSMTDLLGSFPLQTGGRGQARVSGVREHERIQRLCAGSPFELKTRSCARILWVLYIQEYRGYILYIQYIPIPTVPTLHFEKRFGTAARSHFQTWILILRVESRIGVKGQRTHFEKRASPRFGDGERRNTIVHCKSMPELNSFISDHKTESFAFLARRSCAKWSISARVL